MTAGPRPASHCACSSYGWHCRHAEENAPPESQYVAPDALQEDGPVRVILGRYGQARSAIRALSGINYFHVRLKDGQRWRYAPPEGHTVAWLAVDKGALRSPAPIGERQLAVFEESSAPSSWRRTVTHRSSWAPRSSIHTRSCWATTRSTRAERRSLRARRKSIALASSFTPRAACEHQNHLA